jgi:hypothetical protein
VFSLLLSGGRFTFDISNAARAELWQEQPWREHLAAYERDRNAIWQMQAWHSPRTIISLLKEVGFFIEAVSNPDWMCAWLVTRKP